jgi:hypothetical protein
VSRAVRTRDHPPSGYSGRRGKVLVNNSERPALWDEEFRATRIGITELFVFPLDLDRHNRKSPDQPECFSPKEVKGKARY